MTNKQKIKIHLEAIIAGYEIQKNVLETAKNNLNSIRHYKNIDKRFLAKLMENTAKDNQGYDIMWVNIKPCYSGGFDLHFNGSYKYQIERKPYKYEIETETEPKETYFDTQSNDIGFTLYLSGDKSLYYEPQDDIITRLEKSIIARVTHLTEQIEETKKTLSNIDVEIEKLKKYGEMLNKAVEIRDKIPYEVKNSLRKLENGAKTPLDLFLNNNLVEMLER